MAVGNKLSLVIVQLTNSNNNITLVNNTITGSFNSYQVAINLRDDIFLITIFQKTELIFLSIENNQFNELG